jgi:RNA polymerase sigma factor (sigma-70 family)
VDLATSDDGELLRLVRAGEDAAFGELFVRHSSAIRGYALRCCADTAEAEDMAAEAFFRAFQAIRRGSGPADNVRAYLLTVVRRLAGEWSVRKRDVPVADDELGRQVDAGAPAPASRADLQLIATAFTTLPRRWRAVLWRVEVEGERPAVVASHFGLSANATAALARRARRGLRAAYLQAHVGSGATHGCQAVVAKLGAFTAGQVTPAEHARIHHHLAGCASCEALHAELRDVCDGLRRHAGSPTLAGAAAGLGHAGLARTGLGKLGLGKTVLGKTVLRRFAGHLATVGARTKLAVAAVSMAAVGGFGVAAGPLLAHIDPAPPNADRGVTIGPLLATTGATSTTRSSVFPPAEGIRRIVGAFDAAPLRIVFVPHHLRREDDSPVVALARSAGAASTGTTADGTSTGIPDSTVPIRSVQPQDADATPPAVSSATPPPQMQQPPVDPAPLLNSQTPSVTPASTTVVTAISPGSTSDALVP